MGRSTGDGESLNEQMDQPEKNKITGIIRERIGDPLNSQVEQIRRKLGRLFTHAAVYDFDLKQLDQEPFIFGASLPWEPSPYINDQDEFLTITSRIEVADLPEMKSGGNGIDLTHISLETYLGEMGTSYECTLYDASIGMQAVDISDTQISSYGIDNVEISALETEFTGALINCLDFNTIDTANVNTISVDKYKSVSIENFGIMAPSTVNMHSIKIEGLRKNIATNSFHADCAARNQAPHFKKRVDPLRPLAIPVRRSMDAIYKAPLIRKSIAGKKGAGTPIEERRTLAEACKVPYENVMLLGVFPNVPVTIISKLTVEEEAAELLIWLKRDASLLEQKARMFTLIIGRDRASGKIIQTVAK